MPEQFLFRQFTVGDDRCAMKLTSDAVLFGAIISPGNPEFILDIGTGCGILALMLAQRSRAIIDAIEIHPESARQAAQNAASSPWAKQINVVHCDIRNFHPPKPRKYQLIVSNPPFFTRSLKNSSPDEAAARHDSKLTYGDLCSSAAKWLDIHGRLCVIIPAANLHLMLSQAANNNLFCGHTTQIVPKTGGTPNRLILTLVTHPPSCSGFSSLTLRKTDGSYTEEYTGVVKDFYPNF